MEWFYGTLAIATHLRNCCLASKYLLLSTSCLSFVSFSFQHFGSLVPCCHSLLFFLSLLQPGVLICPTIILQLSFTLFVFLPLPSFPVLPFLHFFYFLIPYFSQFSIILHLPLILFVPQISGWDFNATGSMVTKNVDGVNVFPLYSFIGARQLRSNTSHDVNQSLLQLLRGHPLYLFHNKK